MQPNQPELFPSDLEQDLYLETNSSYEKGLILQTKAQELDELKRPSWSVEANFMVLPIFTFDKKQAEKTGRIVHSVPIVKDGTVFTSKLVISATAVEKNGKLVKDSLPGAFDMQVLFCLMDMWDEQGRPESGQVLFRLNTVCTRLKMNDSGRSFEQIKNSIYKLRFTAIESTKAFYSADKSAHVSVPISMIADYAIASHRGNTKAIDSCMVVLGQHILSNLVKNYTAKINRKIYQQLDVGFAQRILCLVLFRQQIDNETGVIDFEINELASLIPISGKLYPSTIMSRLEKALDELLEKKVFKHEYLKEGRTHVLRLTPFEQPEHYLLGSGNISKFMIMVEKVYNKTLFDLIGYTPETLERRLDKDTKTIEYSGRKYSHVYHCIDILLCMMKNGYKALSPSAVLLKLMTTKEDELEIPDNFVPIDVQFKKLLAKEQLKKVVIESQNNKDEADEVLYRTSSSYVALLTPNAYEKYKKEAIESKPMAENSKYMLQAEMTEFIFRDIKSGKVIELISEPKTQLAIEGNA